ncbi:hypothetical protein V1478_000751 [Vespula squamosa]|uniref:FHA domain-containing protein n=1 Tax=Vespula squamosa TaxID=30214 RepID=A0ABD2C6E3_VESSQ
MLFSHAFDENWMGDTTEVKDVTGQSWCDNNCSLSPLHARIYMLNKTRQDQVEISYGFVPCILESIDQGLLMAVGHRDYVSGSDKGDPGW